MVHAAAAEMDGQVVVLSAASEAGKSTMVAALVHAGLSYVTDEAVAIGLDDLLVHPYPKPLDIDAGSWGVLAHLAPRHDPALAPYLAEQWHLAPTTVGTIASAAPARLVILPAYRPSEATALVPISRSEAWSPSSGQAFNFCEYGARALEALPLSSANAAATAQRVRPGPGLRTACRRAGRDGRGGPRSSSRAPALRSVPLTLLCQAASCS